jgi:hypothetical protein
MSEKPAVQEALEKAAQYVASTQPVLDRFMTKEAAFATRIEKTAAILVNRGILNEARKADFIKKCADDHGNALEFMEHLAKLVGADHLGGPSEIKAAAATDQVDPWIKEFFPETCNKNDGNV